MGLQRLLQFLLDDDNDDHDDDDDGDRDDVFPAVQWQRLKIDIHEMSRDSPPPPSLWTASFQCLEVPVLLALLSHNPRRLEDCRSVSSMPPPCAAP